MPFCVLSAYLATISVSGSKTYTVFAPTERAFQGLKDADLARLTTERAGARALVLKHIMPTTFYSAGMRYFQVRESMARGKQITIVNEEGTQNQNENRVGFCSSPHFQH